MFLEVSDEYRDYLSEIYIHVTVGNESKILEYPNWVASDRIEILFRAVGIDCDVLEESDN